MNTEKTETIKIFEENLGQSNKKNAEFMNL